jgi:hypothetical protein
MPLKNRLFVAFLLLATTTAVGQIRPDEAKVVEASDDIHPLLIAHQEAIAQDYKRGGVIVPQFKKWVRVDSVAARQLFPGLRFASIEWDEAADPRAKDHVLGRALSLQTTLAVDPKAGSVVATLPGHGNYEAFGTLLIERKITLRDDADAKVVWEAFCDLHHKHWKDQPHERTADTEWRLGRSSYDQTTGSEVGFKTVVTRTHYMRVRTEPKTYRVLSWESVVDTSNKRRVPVKAE